MMKQLFFGVLIVLVVPTFAAELRPKSVDQGFVEPNTATTFQWTAADGEVSSTEFRILDAWGKPVRTEQGKRDGNLFAVTTTFPQGFWEIESTATKQRFGVVSLPKFEGEADPFFAIDGAMSWLVADDAMREGLVRMAKRSGIGMIRERLTWGGIEPKEGTFDWETNRRYEKLRKYCAKNGVDVLEMFHDAPQWVGKIEKYPDDLVKTAASFETIAKRWSPTWGAFEVWNEPEISFGAELPADQYVPMVKAISYQLKKSGIKTPIFGGVMAHFEKDWLETAADCGLLNAVDGFSFHTYDRAPSMERIVAQYRDWLAKNGKANMPLWLTECGRPWKIGPKRPEIAEDWISAVDITMKGVESRACGVDLYFPFVYPYYEERDSNFGMMDKLGTPSRSFAAYVQMIRMLAGTKFIGNMQIDDPAILRVRQFDKGDETVLVLYTGKLKERTKWKIHGKAIGVESATGEPIAVESGTISLDSESLVYVRVGKNYVTTLQPGGSGGVSPTPPALSLSPIVLRYQFDKERVGTTPQGYFIRRTEEKTLPITVRAFNLDSVPVKTRIRFAASESLVEEKGTEIPARGFVDVPWNLPLAASELVRGDKLKVRVFVDGNPELVLSFKGEATWNGATSTVKDVTELPVGDVRKWVKGEPKICTSDIEKPQADEQAVWRMFATFGEGDRWVYPRIPITAKDGFAGYDGLLVWARCIGNAKPSIMIFEQSGAGYIVAPAVKSDGDWHVVKLPFSMFGHVGATRPDENGKLDLDEIRFLSFGANCTGTSCVLELKKIALYRNVP